MNECLGSFLETNCSVPSGQEHLKKSAKSQMFFLVSSKDLQMSLKGAGVDVH